MTEIDDLEVMEYNYKGWNSTSDYLMEWSRKLKAFNRMVKVRRLFAKK
jgi:hypothetical protein